MFGRMTHAFVYSSDLKRQTAVGEAMRRSQFEVLSFSTQESLVTAVQRLAAACGDLTVLDATEPVASLIPVLDQVEGLRVVAAITGERLPRRWAPSSESGLFWLLSYIKTAPGHQQVGLYLRSEDRERELADAGESSVPIAIATVVPAEPHARSGEPAEASAQWLDPLRARLNHGLLPDYESVDVEWTGEALLLSRRELFKQGKLKLAEFSYFQNLLRFAFQNTFRNGVQCPQEGNIIGNG